MEAFHWEAFTWLSRFRGTGMMGQAMPISEEAMQRFAARRGPDDSDGLEDFMLIIAALDDHFLAHLAKKAPTG